MFLKLVNGDVSVDGAVIFVSLNGVIFADLLTSMLSEGTRLLVLDLLLLLLLIESDLFS